MSRYTVYLLGDHSRPSGSIVRRAWFCRRLRMGKRLRDLVNTTTEDVVVKTGKNAGRTRRSKILGGKGKLTGKVIDNLSRYYGAAIRHNCDSVEKMKNAIWATYYHQQSTDDNPQHDICMSGENSWCPYQKVLATTGVENFQHNYTPLPEDVIQAIKSIYEDLSKDELLERCLGGFTQNANESLNQLIWRIAPKKLSGSKQIVEFAAYVAACTFNEDAGAFLTFLSNMNVSLGPSAHEYVRLEDSCRINRADIRAEQHSKEARIKQRLEKKEAENMLQGLYSMELESMIQYNFQLRYSEHRKSSFSKGALGKVLSPACL